MIPQILHFYRIIGTPGYVDISYYATFACILPIALFPDNPIQQKERGKLRMYANTTLVRRRENLEKEIAQIRKELARMPKGSLIFNNNQLYHQKVKDNGERERTYIRQSDSEIAEKLARKAYLRTALLDKENEKKCLDHFIKYREPRDFGKLLGMDSPYRELLVEPAWDREEYDRNPDYPENLIIPTTKGDLVRSKSEALIANALYELNIPYRYEQLLETEFCPIYPDFTVKKPGGNKLIRWEHFGKIDDEEYRGKVGRKLVTYMASGFVPGQDLIMTFEDKMHPLTIGEVQAMIEHYLL